MTRGQRERQQDWGSTGPRCSQSAITSWSKRKWESMMISHRPALRADHSSPSQTSTFSVYYFNLMFHFGLLLFSFLRSQQRSGLLAQTNAEHSLLVPGRVYPCAIGTVERRTDKAGGGSGWSWRAAIRKEVVDNVGSCGGGVGIGSVVNSAEHGVAKMPEVLLKTSPNM